MAKITEFAAIIRFDKGRGMPKEQEENLQAATPYIDKVLKASEHNFVEKFGKRDPMYIGTGKTKPGQIRANPAHYLIDKPLAKELDTQKFSNSGPERLKWVARATLALDEKRKLGTAFPEAEIRKNGESCKGWIALSHSRQKRL